MKKKLRIIVVSIITLILAIIVTICAIVVQNKPSENVPEVVNLTESTTGTESKIYATETTTNESTIGETTSVEKTTIEATTKKTTSPDYQLDNDTIELFILVNDYREQNGANKMILDEELCKLAYIRAQEQEQREGHQRADGRDAGTVLTDNKYSYSTFGENIVIGPDSDVNESFQCWQDSTGHNKNMLRKEWTRSGIALFVTDDGRYCYVQLFVS